MDANRTYYALPDEAEGAQPSAMQTFLDSIAPGVSPPMAGGGPSISTPYGASGPSVPAPPPPAGSAFDPTQASPVAPPLPALQSFANMQDAPPNIQASRPQAQGTLQIPAPPQSTTMPKWLAALGVLSGLAGGGGANLANGYLQAGDARNANDYRNQLQNYQLQDQQQQQGVANQERQTATQDREKQQTFDNQQSQAQGLQSLMKQMQGMDDDGQEKYINAIAASPGLMNVYGLTPAQIKAQFYGADGTFQPVGSADTGKEATQLAAAQTRAAANFYALSPATQQILHDNSTPDEFTKRYGIPYDGFTPGETQRNVTSEASQQSRARVQQAQAALDDARIKGVASDIKVKQEAFDEAVRRDNLMHQDRQSGQAVTERGQDLTHQDRQASNRIAMTRADISARNSELDRHLKMLKIQDMVSGGSNPLKTLTTIQNEYNKSVQMRNGIMHQINAEVNSDYPDQNHIDQMNAAIERLDKSDLPYWQKKLDDAQNAALKSMPKTQAATPTGAAAGGGFISNGGYYPPAGPVKVPKGGMAPAIVQGVKVMVPKATPLADSVLTPQQRASMTNEQFAQYFANRIAAKFGGAHARH